MFLVEMYKDDVRIDVRLFEDKNIAEQYVKKMETLSHAIKVTDIGISKTLPDLSKEEEIEHFFRTLAEESEPHQPLQCACGRCKFPYFIRDLEIIEIKITPLGSLVIKINNPGKKKIRACIGGLEFIDESGSSEISMKKKISKNCFYNLIDISYVTREKNLLTIEEI
jgi:hypothetical protein